LSSSSENGGKDRSAWSFVIEQREQLALSLMGYVVKWAERARCKQSIARAPKDARLLPTRFSELLDERGLSNAEISQAKQRVSRAADLNLLTRFRCWCVGSSR
jgi:hypothetical protein